MKLPDFLNDISTDSQESNTLVYRASSQDLDRQAFPSNAPAAAERYPRYLTNYKTEICKNFESGRPCKWGAGCCFAHGKEELRLRQPRDEFKLKLCKGFNESGICSYGVRCQFLHFKPFAMYQESLDAFKSNLSHRISTHPKEPLETQLVELQIKSKRLSLFKSLALRTKKPASKAAPAKTKCC